MILFIFITAWLLGFGFGFAKERASTHYRMACFWARMVAIHDQLEFTGEYNHDANLWIWANKEVMRAADETVGKLK